MRTFKRSQLGTWSFNWISVSDFFFFLDILITHDEIVESNRSWIYSLTVRAWLLMSVLIVQMYCLLVIHDVLQLLLHISFTDVYISCYLNNMHNFLGVSWTRKALPMINLGQEIIIQGVCFSWAKCYHFYWHWVTSFATVPAKMSSLFVFVVLL